MVTTNPAGFQPSDLGAALVFPIDPWTVGVLVRQRGARTEGALAPAELLERAVEQRTRIAGELHDVVPHSISVVTIQTPAVRRRLGPGHAAEAEDLAGGRGCRP